PDGLQVIEAGLPRVVGDGVAPGEVPSGFEHAVRRSEELLVLLGDLAAVFGDVSLANGDDVRRAVGLVQLCAVGTPRGQSPAELGDEIARAGLDGGFLHVERLVGALREDVLADVVRPCPSAAPHLDNFGRAVLFGNVLLEGGELIQSGVSVSPELLRIAMTIGTAAPARGPVV